jgi:hypothetical protein
MKVIKQTVTGRVGILLLFVIITVGVGLTIKLAVPSNALGSPAKEKASESSFSGTLQVQHMHFEDKGTSQTTYVLQTTRGENLELNFKDPKVAISEPLFQSGTQVTVRGIRYGNSLTLASASSLSSFNSSDKNAKVLGAVSATEPDLPSTPKVGTRKMAFVLYNFTTDTRIPTTTERIRIARTDIHDYFYEQSYGQLNMVSTDADIYGPFTVSKPTACNARNSKDEVNQKAAAEGISFSQYQHVIYIMPLDTAYCAFGSGTDIGANWVVVNGNRYTGVRVISHELGHNLGLDHASGVRCRAYNTELLNPLGGLTDCDWQEYSDPYDAMNGYYDLY